jgi:hypothetical protein
LRDGVPDGAPNLAACRFFQAPALTRPNTSSPRTVDFYRRVVRLFAGLMLVR